MLSTPFQYGRYDVEAQRRQRCRIGRIHGPSNDGEKITVTLTVTDSKNNCTTTAQTGDRGRLLEKLAVALSAPSSRQATKTRRRGFPFRNCCSREQHRRGNGRIGCDP